MNGVSRPVDTLGRIVIPSEIRKSLGINEGDRLEIECSGERIILSKPTDVCIFCGGTKELTTFSGKNICKACMLNLADIVGV